MGKTEGDRGGGGGINIKSVLSWGDLLLSVFRARV